MKTKSKLRVGILFISLLICFLCVAVFSTAPTNDDPADVYQVRTAPDEDDSIELWFDYSFRKTYADDTTSTGMDTFSIYMAKNEIEDAQFVLYSDEEHTGMTAEISQFTDSRGNTVDTSLYYEMYVTTEGVNATKVLGSTADTTFIRSGETPDPIAPLSAIGAFQLNEGKSQAFLIRVKTAPDSVSGWYSAELNVKNSLGETVKTAEVYAYVWDVELSEKTALKTAVFVDDNNAYGGNYQTFYDYLLENRICAMDLPDGPVSSTSEYLLRDRVVAARVSYDQFPNYLSGSDFIRYPAIYNDLVSSPHWDEIKDKLYFYLMDEPLPSQYGRWSDSDVVAQALTLDKYWGSDANVVLTSCEDHLWNAAAVTADPNTLPQKDVKDSVQKMLEDGYVTVYCPRTYEFTPYDAVISQPNRQWAQIDCIRNSSDYPISGIYGPSATPCYMDWEAFYGAETSNRYLSDVTYKNLHSDKKYSLWAYCGGDQFSYSYANHAIENTGLQSKILWWQLFQEDVTGYLYYGANEWDEHSSPVDSTVTGSRKNCVWRTNKYSYGTNNNVYGDGILFYGGNMGKVRGVSIIGTLRVEIMRDGIEEYQMLSQLADIKGNAYAKEIVSRISNNVVDYISMPLYDRSSWDSSMDEYDIMEATRRALGFELEYASAAVCDHTYDAGVVTKAAACTKTGVLTRTCTKCGALSEECIPSVHTTGDTFVYVEGSQATCNTDGNAVYECSVCGFQKRNITLSCHADRSRYEYACKSATTHDIICPLDGEAFAVEGHCMFTTVVKPTCESAGYTANECKYCHYNENVIETPALGHDFVDGKCAVCGISDPSAQETEIHYGDVDGNDKVNSTDLNLIRKYVSGIVSLEGAVAQAADVNGDGKVTAIDISLVYKYISGIIAVFPAEQ